MNLNAIQLNTYELFNRSMVVEKEKLTSLKNQDFAEIIN